MSRSHLILVILASFLCTAPAPPRPPFLPTSRPVPSTRPAFRPAATPTSLSDLRAIQSQVQQALDKVLPATVAVLTPTGQGSGVIVKDGYVLTAGHVAADAGLDVILLLSDGRFARGKTLGIDRRADAALIKITPPGDWPFVEIADPAPVKVGHWCIALGHPGGFRRDRPPVLRLGRIVYITPGALISSCTLVSGDSGGPLFDLQGRLIGIHSRIGQFTSVNMHVPIYAFTLAWDRLAKGDVWGPPILPIRGAPPLGAFTLDHEKGAIIENIVPGSPADKAGLRLHDVIVSFNSQTVRGRQHLANLLSFRRAGDEIKLQVLRGDQTLPFTIKLPPPQ
jgi:serine protease Do